MFIFIRSVKEKLRFLLSRIQPKKSFEPLASLKCENLNLFLRVQVFSSDLLMLMLFFLSYPA